MQLRLQKNRLIGIAEVKTALRNQEFRKKLPKELLPDIQKYEQNPGCPCNIQVYHKILRHAVPQLKELFPDREIAILDNNNAKFPENRWSIINCHVDELEKKLKALAPGRKQIAMARWENQITVIVNELEWPY